MPDHPTFVAALEGLEPESFIGRLVAVFFDPPGTFFEGEVISFELPHEDDSPDTAADGTLYKVRFSDGDQHDYNITELKNILMPVGKFYDSLPKRKWLRIKLVYSFLGASLRSGYSNLTDPLFLKKVFSIRKPGAVSSSNLKKIYTALIRYLHDDKISRQPANVRFVATMTLNAMRFYLEHYSHVNGGGPAPSIDPPMLQTFLNTHQLNSQLE